MAIKLTTFLYSIFKIHIVLYKYAKTYGTLSKSFQGHNIIEFYKNYIITRDIFMSRKVKLCIQNSIDIRSFDKVIIV